MSDIQLVSIFCADRRGLVAAITGTLFDLGVNLGDTTFAVLGTGAEFTAVCETPRHLEPKDLEAQLRSITHLAKAAIKVSRFDLSPVQGSTANITHYVAIQGGDHPGLVARLSEVFVDFDANIVRLDAKKLPTTVGDQYLINFAVWIPETRTEACLASVQNTASALQMRCRCNVAKGTQALVE